MEQKQRKIDRLLQQEMSRKQFLGGMLGVAAGVMGFSSILGLLTKSAPSTESKRPGYGEQGYGP